MRCQVIHCTQNALKYRGGKNMCRVHLQDFEELKKKYDQRH